jgi:hypothetical protein
MIKPPNVRPFAADVERLLASERALVAQPEDLRHRAVSRALGAAAAGAKGPAKPWLWLMVAAAAMLVVASLSAGAVQAQRRLRESHVEPAAPSEPLAKPPTISQEAHIVATESATEPLEPIDADIPRRPAPAGTSRGSKGIEGHPLELDILQPSRSAVAQGDFAAALRSITEHERRYPDGQLREEREALRIQALTGLHRTDEVRRAVVAFRERFPHSVLISRMNESVRTTP